MALNNKKTMHFSMLRTDVVLLQKLAKERGQTVSRCVAELLHDYLNPPPAATEPLTEAPAPDADP